MATNELTKVAGLVAHAVMGAKVKDKDGNAKTVKPTGDDNLLDLTDIVAGSSTGGGGNPENPSAGVDYYAGDLYSGEITGRYLLYQNDDSVDVSKPQKVVLMRDVGSKFNMAGEGAQFLVHLTKTILTKGAKGSVSSLNLNYDPKNQLKSGYYTTTSPYPIYISSRDLATKKELSVPINGIGENLNGKNVKSPELKVTFNGDGTLTYQSISGYDNDGDSAGATGANYDVIVDVISTFSTQDPVSQLPSTVNLFQGSSTDDIALAGTSDFFENVSNGLEIFLDDYAIEAGDLSPTGIKISNLNVTSPIKVDKKYLIDGYKFKFAKLFNLKTPGSKVLVEVKSSSTGKWTTASENGSIDSTTFNFQFSQGSIIFNNSLAVS